LEFEFFKAELQGVLVGLQEKTFTLHAGTVDFDLKIVIVLFLDYRESFLRNWSIAILEFGRHHVELIETLLLCAFAGNDLFQVMDIFPSLRDGCFGILFTLFSS
jgi:hypothetical protein